MQRSWCRSKMSSKVSVSGRRSKSFVSGFMVVEVAFGQNKTAAAVATSSAPLNPLLRERSNNRTAYLLPNNHRLRRATKPTAAADLRQPRREKCKSTLHATSYSGQPQCESKYNVIPVPSTHLQHSRQRLHCGLQLRLRGGVRVDVDHHVHQLFEVPAQKKKHRPCVFRFGLVLYTCIFRKTNRNKKTRSLYPLWSTLSKISTLAGKSCF